MDAGRPNPELRADRGLALPGRCCTPASHPALGYRTEQHQDLFNGEVYPEFDFANDDPLRLNDLVDGYLTVDAGAGYNPGGNENLRIEAYVQNATDEQREQAIVITQFDNTRFFSRPRTYGLRFRWRR